MQDRDDALYAEMVRLLPPSRDLFAVEPVSPLSLPEGARRIQDALADRDFLTAMAVAKRMAVTKG